MTSAETLVGAFTVLPGDILLYLDPRSLDQPKVEGVGVLAETRWELRRVYETQLRPRDATQAGIFVHSTCADIADARDLPVDLAKLPMIRLTRRLGALQGTDVATLPWPARRALAAAGPWDERLAAAGRELTAQTWPPPDPNNLAAALLLLAAAPDASSHVRELWGAQCPTGQVRDLLLADNPYTWLQELWNTQPARVWAAGAEEALQTLVAGGYLKSPATPRPANATWRPASTLSWPTIEPAAELSGWRNIAQQLASRRFALATTHADDDGEFDARFRAWRRPVDDAWTRWLRANYDQLLSRSPVHPVAVHKIPMFLWRTVVSRGQRFILLVLDGLGLAQWAALRGWLNLTPLEEHIVMAGLPTITSVSRQSIFSGVLPSRFPDSLTTTAKEGNRWSTFWINDGGLSPDQVRYSKTQGATAADWTGTDPKAIATGVAAVAIDDLMHGSSVNGDRQFFASLQTWSRHGYLEAALNWAHRSETQLWITSDHGNLAAHGLERTIPQVGVVASKGRRVMVFDSPSVRDQWAVDGLAWQPPGFPTEGGYPLFALGDSSFQRGGISVSHGGLSLEEVLVPLARLA